LDDTFLVPSYQRGFRWSKEQVIALLDDLDEFHEARSQELLRRSGDGDEKEVTHPTSAGEFYCLQPVVVLSLGKDDDGRKKWELIDGQQRLTTILLIIRFLESQGIRVRGKYTLSYKTRNPRYFEALDDELRWETPDDHYIFEAYSAIKQWFEDRHHEAPENIAAVLLSSSERAFFKAKVIWYQLPDPPEGTSNEIEAFIRLNAGKIRLTNAELIRALLLKATNFTPELAPVSQLKIAQEWDRIEKRLHEDRFWFFIHGSESPHATRIDYLFTVYLLQQKCNVPSTEYGTFLCFQDLVVQDRKSSSLSNPSRKNAEDLWDGIKHLAQRLEEWEHDRVLYHLIGYWINVRVNDYEEDSAKIVVELLRRREGCKHQDFEEGLKASIFTALVHCRTPLSELDGMQIRYELDEWLGQIAYGNEQIRPLLLLFNIATLLRNPSSTVRFPFDQYSRQRWDIEHIRSVESGKPGNVSDRKKWLATVIEYWTGHRPDDDYATVNTSSGPPQEQITEVSRLCSLAKILLDDSPPDPSSCLQLSKKILESLGSDVDFEFDAYPDPGLERDRSRYFLEVTTLRAEALGLLVASTFDAERFDDLYTRILQHFGESKPSEIDHTIGNLTLLDSHTNRSYKNAVFPVKRKHILALDKTGTFVPLCTTNVFLKYYSRKLDQMMLWTEDCGDSYQCEIAETLTAFFVKGGHRPEKKDHE